MSILHKAKVRKVGKVSHVTASNSSRSASLRGAMEFPERRWRKRRPRGVYVGWSPLRMQHQLIAKRCEGVYGDGAAWVMADKELWTLLEGLLLGRAVLPRCAPARVKRLLGMPAAEGKGTLIKLSEEEAMYLSVALRVLTIYSIGREELLPSDKLRVLERGTARDPSFWQGESGEREEASVGRDDDAASDESLSEAMEPFHGEDEDDEELSEGVVAAQNQAPIEEADSEWRQREGACVAGRRGEELAEGDMGQGGLSPGPPLPQSQSGLVRLTVDAFWRACCSKDPSFPACYAAYHHCRAKGWLPKSGLQYGADYMLYRAHPTVAHSEFVATVLPESAKIGGEPRMQAGRAGFPDWRDQQALSRLSLQVSKGVLALHVEGGGASVIPSTVTCLSQLSVREVQVIRWSPNTWSRGREAGSGEDVGEALADDE